jgi:hypothetical protein
LQVPGGNGIEHKPGRLVATMTKSGPASISGHDQDFRLELQGKKSMLMCEAKGVQPDYFDVHHELAAKLPFGGNFGPVKMLVLERK